MADEPTTAPTDTQVNTNDPSAATVDTTATPEAKAPGLMGEGAETKPTEGEATPAEGEEAKPEAEAETVPEVYEAFTTSEGYEMSEVQHEAFSAEVKDLGLTQTQAQKLVDFDMKRQAEFAKESEAAQEVTVKEWVSELKTEFGDKYEEEVSIAGKAFEAFASPKLQELLNNTKLNYNPEVVKMFRDMGKKMSEDSFEKGGHAVKGKNEGGLVDMFSDLNTKT